MAIYSLLKNVVSIRHPKYEGGVSSQGHREIVRSTHYITYL